MLHCANCGSEITSPKWKDGECYGWKCFETLFLGEKSNSEKYVPVTVVRVVRNWNDVISSLSDEAKSIFTGKSVITFSIPNTKMLGSSDHGVERNGQWYVQESQVKDLIKAAKKRKMWNL